MSAGSSRKAPGWSRKAWSGLGVLAGEERRVESLGRAPLVEDDQVELELVVDAGEDLHLVVELDERRETALVRASAVAARSSPGLMQIRSTSPCRPSAPRRRAARLVRGRT